MDGGDPIARAAGPGPHRHVVFKGIVAVGDIEYGGMDDIGGKFPQV